MSLIQGSRGLIYFVHQFKPTFREAALLDDPEMLEGVTALNHQIIRLAPVLNSQPVANLVSAKSEDSSIPISFTCRRSGGAIWIFAVPLREGETSVTFTLKQPCGKSVEALDENRSVPVENDSFKDRFGRWETHLYRIAP